MLFVSSNAEGAHSVASLAVDRRLTAQLLQHLGGSCEAITALAHGDVQHQLLDAKLAHRIRRFGVGLWIISERSKSARASRGRHLPCRGAERARGGTAEQQSRALEVDSLCGRQDLSEAAPPGAASLFRRRHPFCFAPAPHSLCLQHPYLQVFVVVPARRTANMPPGSRQAKMVFAAASHPELVG